MKRWLFAALLLILYSSATISASQSDSEFKADDQDSTIYSISDQHTLLNKKYGGYFLNPKDTELETKNDNGIILDIPVNDNCSDAIVIGDVENYPFDMVGATHDGGNFSNELNVWFKYTSQITGGLRVGVEDTVNCSFYDYGEITVYDGLTCPEPIDLPDPVNLLGGETIETAVPLNFSLPFVVNGNVEGYERDYEYCSCVSFLPNGGDAVYSYTATDDDTISLALISEMVSFPGVNVAMIVMNEDGEELDCGRILEYQNFDDDDDLAGTAIYSFPVVSGETYYIVVANVSGDPNDYTLIIYSPEYKVVGKVYSIATYFEMYFDAVAGHEYLIEVGQVPQDDPNIIPNAISIGPAPTPPPNDNCADATDGGILSCDTPLQFTGNNIGSTRECDKISLYNRDVWVKFTTEEVLDIRIDYCGYEAIQNYLEMTSSIYPECPCNTPVESIGAQSDPEHWFITCPNVTFLWLWRNLPPGTYYYPIIVHRYFEGDYVANFTAKKPQNCADNALFGQPPTTIYDEDWTFFSSDIEVGYTCADKFSGVESSIGELTWWGATSDFDTGESCDPVDPQPFQIIFCNTHPTSPYLPGDTATIFEVAVTPELSAYEYNDVPQKKFTIYLDDPIELNEGWVMIKSLDDFNNCVFYLQNSHAGGSGLQYDMINSQWERINTGLAYCLGPGVNAIDDELVGLPASIELSQNYPNPFNATTSIQFSLKTADEVSLSVFDIGGRLIKTLHRGGLTAGNHSITWDGTNESGDVVSSGVYFYRLNTSERSINKSMIFLK